MPTPPPCTALGRHCRELTVTLRIATLDEDSQTLQDAAATWLLGHTENITMGKLYVENGHLQVDAVIHVPCKYLEVMGRGQQGQRGQAGQNGKAADGFNGNWTTRVPGPVHVHCTAHGFTGNLPGNSRRNGDQREQFHRRDGKFPVVFRGKQRTMVLPLKRAAQKALPVLRNGNPCVDAPCRTADNKQGAACCRDLQLDVLVSEFDEHMEALLHSRKSPYLCKVSRDTTETMECEVISACSYLEPDGISCALHDRVLPNGRLAKPSICYEWPDLGPDDTGHPGCPLL
jgi:hypothetical protein